MAAMEVTLLGPVEAHCDGEPLPLGGPQQRALLALLALRVGEAVPLTRLIDELWPEEPPASAAKVVQTYVARLRRALGPEQLVTRGAGYALELDAGDVDARRFEKLLRAGRPDEALALWHGPALADVGFVPALRDEAARLEELRLQAVEARLDGALAAGRHAESVAELQSLVAEHRYRERLCGQLMLALYRCGRQAEALEAYRATREALVEELGLEPGPELREVERRILTGEAELGPDPAAPSLPPLPQPLGPLVGRQEERAELAARLSDAAVRLVTLVGPGGVGKTRLALEVARVLAEDAVDAAVFVDLASLDDAALVPSAIARALGADEASDEAIAEALSGRRVLLVLDNLEQLPAAGPAIAALLQRAPAAQALCTSRGPLRLRGEQVVELEPLPLEDATRLFDLVAGAAARSVPADDAEVAEICRRLDGLPLAIELVAARLAVLPPAALLRALEDGGGLGATGPADLPERQRTLDATIAWSYRLLNEEQRRLHASLGVFAGGCSLEDAEAVAEAGESFVADVEELVAAALVRSRPGADGTPRLQLLRTVRAFALARLAEEGRLDGMRARHADRFLTLARAAEHGLAGAEQIGWVELLEREHDNLRAALDWALGAGRAEEALDAIASLDRFWWAHGHVAEARRLLAAGLEREGLSPEVQGRASWAAARQALGQSDHAAAIPLLRVAVPLVDEGGTPDDAVFARCDLCFALTEHGALDEAELVAHEALAAARSLNEPRPLSAALNVAAVLADERRDFRAARTLYAESLELRRALGDPLLVANSTNNLGIASIHDGDLSAAETALTETLAIARELGNAIHTASALCGLGEIALLREEPRAARPLLEEALAIYDELGDDPMRTECLHVLGGVEAAEGSPAEAARLWGAAQMLRAARGATPGDVERAVTERWGEVVAQGEDDAEPVVTRTALE
jgi:predicted ATPase/DNA-binding SARP family transcriptional activator